MDEQSLALQNRLIRVEKELRFWRCAFAASALLAFVVAASSGDEIVAKKITITGAQGQPLITLGSWGQGAGGLIVVNSTEGTETPVEAEDRDLTLYKELGRNWGAAIVGLPSHAAIKLSSKNGVAGEAGAMTIRPTGIAFSTKGSRGAGLSARDPYEYEDQGHKRTMDGSTSLILMDDELHPSSARGREIEVSLGKDFSQLNFEEYTEKSSRRQATLRVNADGTPQLNLYGKVEGSGVVAAVSPDGDPLMILTGDRARGRLDLHVPDGQPRVDLFGTRPQHSEWMPRVSLFAAPDGISALTFSDKDSNPIRTMIGVDKDGKPFLR